MKIPATVRAQVRASRSADGETSRTRRRDVTGEVAPKKRREVVRAADAQPTARATKACPLQEGDAVLGPLRLFKDGTATSQVGIIVGRVTYGPEYAQMVSWAMRNPADPVYEVLWSGGNLGIERGVRLRRILQDPDL